MISLITIFYHTEKLHTNNLESVNKILVYIWLQHSHSRVKRNKLAHQWTELTIDAFQTFFSI